MTDVKQICRLCLDPTSDSSIAMDDDTLLKKLSAISNLAFDTGDHLPSKVCSECFNKIDELYKFVEMVRSNQDQLWIEHSWIKVEPIQCDARVEPESEDIKVKEQIPDDDDDDKHQMIYVEVNPQKDDPDVDRSDDDQSEMDSVNDDDEQNSSKNKQATPKTTISEAKAKKWAEEDRLIGEHFRLGCKTCAETFQTWRGLAQHTKKLHKTEPSVDCCNKTFYKKSKILSHINRHRKPCQCETCGKAFADKYALKKHIEQKHTETGDKPFKCEQCGQGFLEERMLKNHLKWHVETKCTVCNKVLSSAYSLKTHMQNKHSKSHGFVCPTCGKQFQSRYFLETHVKNHSDTPQEIVPCSICTKPFTKKYLPLHMKEVHSGKPVTCDVCFKVFPYDRALRSHKSRAHVEQAQTFDCEICDKQYKKQLHLKEHMASHAGLKLYSCEVCGMEMNSKANLYNHRKNKHPEEWQQRKQRKYDSSGLEDK